MKLLVATGNEGKKREYSRLLASLPFEIVSLRDVGIVNEVPETGCSFAENALIKARSYAAASGLATLADDSGLEVDALGGAPGVLSARYGGPGLDDRARYELLLSNLINVPEEQRTARFRCVIALVWPDGREATASGACEGHILRAPQGQGGFGYDPVFWVEQEGLSMAELSLARKNEISHRAAAARAAGTILQAWLGLSSSLTNEKREG